MNKKLENKYKKELSFFSTEKDFNEKWLLMLQDLINASESIWDYNSVRYDTVMNKKEWDTFSKHPERTPYKSKIFTDGNFITNFDKILEIVKDSYELYKTLKKSQFRDKLKSSTSSLLDCVLNAKYDLEVMRLADTLAGRTDDERDDGIINPTPGSLSKLDYAIREYSYLTGKNYEETKKRIYDICGGRVSILSEFYGMCDMDIATRMEIKQILEVFRRDLTLAFADLKIGWEIWKTIRSLGINVDTYLELIDLPKYSVVEKNLLAFMNNKEFENELLKHMKDEFPKSYKEYIKSGFVDSVLLDAEEAERKKYPKSLRKEDEVEAMIEECKKEIYEYFPLAKYSSPRNILMNPTHPQSTGRAFQSSTKNINGDRVNVIVMTPRVLPKDEYLPVIAHETAHAMHKFILEKGEKSKILENGASERVPSSVMEDFSQLVEHLFYKDKNLPYQKKFKGKEFPNFRSGLVIRVQVPYALVQLGIRKEFDKLWDEGKRDGLDENFMWNVMYKYDKKVAEWMKLGIKINYGHISCLRFFVSYNPDDGLVYMKRYITENKTKTKVSQTQKTTLTMAESLKQKYGTNWVENKEARTKLLWLLLESGRNYKTESFGEFVLNKNANECLSELLKAGVSESDI